MWYKTQTGKLVNLSNVIDVRKSDNKLYITLPAVGDVQMDYFDSDEQAAYMLESIGDAIRDGFKLFNAAHWLANYKPEVS